MRQRVNFLHFIPVEARAVGRSAPAGPKYTMVVTPRPGTATVRVA